MISILLSSKSVIILIGTFLIVVLKSLCVLSQFELKMLNLYNHFITYEVNEGLNANTFDFLSTNIRTDTINTLNTIYIYIVKLVSLT